MCNGARAESLRAHVATRVIGKALYVAIGRVRRFPGGEEVVADHRMPPCNRCPIEGLSGSRHSAKPGWSSPNVATARNRRQLLTRSPV
jgi:hypothetical protein